MPPQAPAATAPTGVREASWEDVVTAVAKQQGVNPLLALAVAKKESSLNPQAIGDSGKAFGLFQLHDAAAQDVGVDKYNPLQNITGGIKYLKTLSDRYQGDVNKTLMAYNGGMDNVDKGTVSSAAQAYAADVIASLSQNMRETAMPSGGAGGGVPSAPAAPAAPAAGNPVSDFLGGARAQLARTVFGGGDLIRRAFGMERVITTPEVQAGMTAPSSTAGRAGQFLTEVAEFAIPASMITKTVKGLGIARQLATAGVSPVRARLAAAAAEGSAQAASAAGLSALHGDDPTAAAVVSAAMPVVATAVTSMAPAIRRAATTRLARFMERGMPGGTAGVVTPEMERQLVQAANDFIDLPLQRTWRATARLTRGKRQAAGQNLAGALAGPLGDTPVPVGPILQGLDDLVAEAQHIIPAGQGQLRTVTYKKGVTEAVADLKTLLLEYDTAYQGLVPARQLHDLKSVWQAAVFPRREAAKPVSAIGELLTTAQKEAYLRGSREIGKVLERNAPSVADLDDAVSHAIKLDQFVKRLAGKARTSSLAKPSARYAIGAVGGGLGVAAGSTVGHPIIGAHIGYATSRMLISAIESPRWRLAPIATRRKLADALARGDAETARTIVTPLVAALTGNPDNILNTLPPGQQPGSVAAASAAGQSR